MADHELTRLVAIEHIAQLRRDLETEVERRKASDRVAFQWQSAAQSLQRDLEAERAQGWQPAPLPKPIDGGFLLVEFGFVHCEPGDRDRFAYMGCWMNDPMVPSEKRGKWLEQGGHDGWIDEYVIVRWLWLRRGGTISLQARDASARGEK